MVNLPFDVFKKAYVDTGVYIFSQKPSSSYFVYRFPKKESSPNMKNIEYTTIPTEMIGPPDYKIVLNPFAKNILERSKSNPDFVSLGQFTSSTQGLALSKYKLYAEAKGEYLYPILLKGKAYRYGLEIHVVFSSNG